MAIWHGLPNLSKTVSYVSPNFVLTLHVVMSRTQEISICFDHSKGPSGPPK